MRKQLAIVSTRRTRFDAMPGGGVCRCLNDASPTVCDDCPRERAPVVVEARNARIVERPPPPDPKTPFGSLVAAAAGAFVGAGGAAALTRRLRSLDITPHAARVVAAYDRVNAARTPRGRARATNELARAVDRLRRAIA